MDGAGTRAAGMGGAFVAVVDDASAVYWNPGALATGSFFSLVLDRTEGRTGLDEPAAGSRSAFLIALAAPALGLSYYRLRVTTVRPPDLAAGAPLGGQVVGPGQAALDSLVTHHVGATLVQSLTDGLAAGATLKLVRGTATAAVVRETDRESLLGDGLDFPGRSTTEFDADLGIAATAGPVRAGLTVRNARELVFRSSDGTTVTLERQVRAGVALLATAAWTLAADFDLVTTRGAFGEVRDIALGTEARLARRAIVRGGMRFNTAGNEGGHAPSVSAGASYAVLASFLVDAQVTVGSERSMRGWGVAGRFLY
jgi:F plasmid transfer operon, TraF, protein